MCANFDKDGNIGGVLPLFSSLGYYQTNENGFIIITDKSINWVETVHHTPKRHTHYIAFSICEHVREMRYSRSQYSNRQTHHSCV